MRLLLLISFALYSTIIINAQELPVSQLYLHNLSLLNPACIGREYCTSIYAIDRHQWLGIPQAPSTQVVGIEHVFFSNPYQATKKNGIELQIIKDRNGSIHQTGGQAGYAFHVRLNKKKDLMLSLGLAVSLMQHSIREAESNIGPDPILGAGETQLLPDAMTGVQIYSPRYFAGFAVAQLLPSAKSFYKPTITNHFPGNYFLEGGIHITPRSAIYTLTPVIVFKFNQQFQKQIDFTMISDFHPWQFGVSYRRNLDLLPGQTTGLQFLLGTAYKRLLLNYVAEVSLNSTQFSHFGSHEFSITYRICYREKPQCPAFE